MVGVGQLAFDVEGVGEGDEDGFFFYFGGCVSECSRQTEREREHALSNDDEPDWTTRRHSLNLARAAASWAYDDERCSTSPSSCFLTAVSCWAVRVVRSTVGGNRVCQ